MAATVGTIAVGILRFAGLVAVGAGVVAAASLAAGALFGASLRRSVALGLYGVGSFVLLGGFFVGNRGPIRGAATLALLAPRSQLQRRRWATVSEQDEAINLSAVFVVFGLALIAIAVVVDSDSDLV